MSNFEIFTDKTVNLKSVHNTKYTYICNKCQTWCERAEYILLIIHYSTFKSARVSIILFISYILVHISKVKF